MTLPVKLLRQGVFTRLCLILACCLLLAGCSGQGVLLSAFKPVVAAADSAERDQIVEYLGLAVQDLSVIDTILANSDLDLLDQGTGADEELTVPMIERYTLLLADYRSSVGSTRSAAATRLVPDQASLSLYQDAQDALFGLTDDLLAEYEQILNYSAALMQMGTNLESLEFYDENDLDATYQTISTAIQESVATLESIAVPTFLTYMNVNLTDALKQMDEAVLYTLQAAYLNDPLRLNAATYRMDILMRHFDGIIANVDQDMTDRQNKLTEEIVKISQTKDGLKTWASQNIDLLNQD